jgi:hypothetical protein
VVTDLTTCHNTWFHPLVDRCFVPTEYCRRSALKNGLKDRQVTVHGLPIRPAFSARIASKRVLRKRLGLDRHLPTVLLVGVHCCPPLHLPTRTSHLSWGCDCPPGAQTRQLSSLRDAPCMVSLPAWSCRGVGMTGGVHGTLLQVVGRAWAQ